MKILKLMKRFNELPKKLREIIAADLETAFEERIKVMERINTK